MNRSDCDPPAGDWAGNRFNGGKQACEAYVNSNPAAFEDVSFSFRSESLMYAI